MSDLPVKKTKADYFPEAHPQEYREWAYQLWAFVCDQKATRVAERIANPEPDDPIEPREISARTIREWAKSEKWLERVEKDMKAIAPGIHQRVTTTIVAGSIEAADYLRQLINDETAEPKFRLDAAKTFLDRAGHLPWTRPSDNSKPVGPTRDYSESFAGKSTDDIVKHLFGTFTDKKGDPGE